MPIRSRTIFNIQGLFVSPYSGSIAQPYLSNYKVLKPLKNIQSVDYTIDQDLLALGSFGSKSSIYRGNTSPTTVSLAFTYIPDGITNEKRLNFNAYTFKDSPSLAMKNIAFSGIDNLIKDRKDFYLTVNKNENDIFIPKTLDNAYYSLSTFDQIIDQNSKNYGLLHFQNCYLNSYSFSITTNSLPSVTQNYVCDNLSFYSSGILFTSDDVGAFNFDLQFSRNTQRKINYKFPLQRTIKYPIAGNVSFGLLVAQDFTGSFFDTLNRNSEYNIEVNFTSNRKDINTTKMIFSGCKFNNIQYSSNINNSKLANLQFNFEQDFSSSSRGLFWSGNIEYATILGTKYIQWDD